MNNQKKRILPLLFTILYLGVVSYSQNAPIIGSFQIGVDYSGNEIVFFQGTNQSGYNLPITVRCTNEDLHQQKSWTITLFEGNSFFIGPKQNWLWMSGEKLTILFQNGQSVDWVYNPTKNGNNSNSLSQNRNFPGSNEDRKELLRFEIDQLKWKIRDARRSLHLYENWGSRNFTISNFMLQQSMRQLIQTYENQRYSLTMDLINLE